MIHIFFAVFVRKELDSPTSTSPTSLTFKPLEAFDLTKTMLSWRFSWRISWGLSWPWPPWSHCQWEILWIVRCVNQMTWWPPVVMPKAPGAPSKQQVVVVVQLVPQSTIVPMPPSSVKDVGHKWKPRIRSNRMLGMKQVTCWIKSCHLLISVS